MWVNRSVSYIVRTSEGKGTGGGGNESSRRVVGSSAGVVTCPSMPLARYWEVTWRGAFGGRDLLSYILSNSL